MLKASFVATTLLLTSLHQAAALDRLPPLSDGSVEHLLSNYLQTWSSNGSFSPSVVGKFYADRVTYYGKPMSRSNVLADKQRYVAVWPQRRYSLVPGTHAVACDAQRSACVVSGIMQWDRRGTRGQHSVGTARLRLLVTADSAGRIARESASILR